MALWGFMTLFPKALTLVSRTVLMGVARPAAAAVSLRACWSLPRSDWNYKATASQSDRKYKAFAHEGLIFL